MYFLIEAFFSSVKQTRVENVWLVCTNTRKKTCFSLKKSFSQLTIKYAESTKTLVCNIRKVRPDTKDPINKQNVRHNSDRIRHSVQHC